MRNAILFLSFVLLVFGCAQDSHRGHVHTIAEQAALSPQGSVKEETLVKAKEKEPPAMPKGDFKELIDAGQWGFSSRDLESGVIAYYTSRGAFIGER